MRCSARSSGAALITASSGLYADGASGSRSSTPTGVQTSWKRLLSGWSSRVSLPSSHHWAAASSALKLPAEDPVTAASSRSRDDLRRYCAMVQVRPAS
jgi:hypothetical protein